MPDTPTANPPRPRVSIDAEVWSRIDQLLADMPFKVAAPIVSVLQQTGGVIKIELPQP